MSLVFTLWAWKKVEIPISYISYSYEAKLDDNILYF